MLDAEYVVPFRGTADSDLADLAGYLGGLVDIVDVTVVDGSDPVLVEDHRRLLDRRVRVIEPTPRPGRNGKVRGVVTGAESARHERIVLADDDVRYDERMLRRVVSMLDDADLVRPQNHFVPQPWHARWDTARSLLNRAVGSDWPGTFAVRRAALLTTGGYDGDVLFENLELVRTLRAAGGHECVAPDVFVARRPPTVSHFLGQRIRQAYDSFAQPTRFAAELALLPLIAWAARRPVRLVVLAAVAVSVAEVGRRRSAGARVFPATASLWAPAWLVERAVCVWLALILRLRGGVRYSEGRLVRAATPSRTLHRRFGGPIPR